MRPKCYVLKKELRHYEYSDTSFILRDSKVFQKRNKIEWMLQVLEDNYNALFSKIP